LLIHKQTIYISMIFRIVPLPVLLLLTWSCNEPHKSSLTANQPTIQDTIGNIPMKYFAIANVPQESDTAQYFHTKGANFQSENLDSAIFYTENAYRIRYSLYPKHWTTGKTLLNLGNFLVGQKDFIRAQRCLEKALLTDAPPRDQMSIRGDMNTRLADCYNELAEARLAKNHLLKAIEIFQSIDNQSGCKSPYLALANYYKMANDPTEAMQYVQKYRTVYNIKDSSDIGKGFLTEGSIFRLQKSYNNSITAFNRALDYFKDSSMLNDRGGTYIELAKTLLETNQFAEARSAIDTGLNIWLKQEIKIPDLIEGYLISGKIYEKVDNHQKAMEEYEKAGRFGQDYGWFLMEPLYEKAQLLTKTAPDKAYQTYLTLDSVIMRSRFQIKSDSAKLTWAKQTHHIYEKMIGLAAQLHDKTNNKVEKKAYLNKIHHFFAQSTAVLLASEWAKSEARQFVNVPQSVLEKEKNIYKTLLISQQESIKKNNVQKATDALFDFERTLERAYPAYYAAKYAYLVETTQNVDRIQQQLNAKDRIGLIEYFYGDSTIYSLSVSADSLFLHQLPVAAVEDPLKIFQKHCETGQMPVSAIELTKINFNLYEKLLQPSLSRLPSVNRLRIVRDGLLNQLSFDALFTRRCDSLTAKEPLLLQKYSISYLETLYQAIAKTKPSKQDGYDFGAMSFYYDSVNASVSNLKFGKLDLLPNTLLHIHHTLFPKSGHYWSDKTKTTLKYPDLFKKEIPKHRMMIFGGHGQANFEHPLESMLAFPPNDSLNQLDLIGLERGCNQLMVPLACQSGVGRTEGSEGMLSLSRGFIRGGYPAVTGSLWSIPEETSAQIIGFFTENLQKGMPKDKAMQKAKIDFLNLGVSNNDRLYRNWAGHVLYGNVEPIDFQSNTSSYKYWILLFGVGIVVWKRKRIAQIIAHKRF
jgi:CHAT domain-containing protein/Tfp pilus assembly protein PilF